MTLLPLLLSCAGPSAPPPVSRPIHPPPSGAGPLADGCPVPGQALARTIVAGTPFRGDVAVGTTGDLLLANEVVAFVITRPDAGTTYFHYGGIVADAVALDGCEQVSDDGLDEVGLVVGSLDLADFERSILRGFRGTRAEVLADGADGGPAIVRVTGTDAPYWLVEYELVRAKVDDGGRPLSAPYGLELVLDYVLEPGSPVLRIEWTLRNAGTDTLELLTAALLSFAPTYDVATGGTSAIAFAGLSLDAGIPFLSATDGAGALAYGVVDGNLAYTGIAGIDVALDLDQALARPIALPPGGEAGRAALLSVGPTDGPTATGPLVEHDPARIPGATATVRTVEGTVRDPSGAVPGARVELLGDGGGGAALVDLAYADAEGRFRLAVPDFTPAPWTFTAVATAPGRDPGPTTPIGQDLEIGPAGSLSLDVREAGEPVPARVALVRDDGLRLDLWTTGTGAEPVPPGTWTATVTRGYEYEPVVAGVVVPADGAGSLAVALERVVDTAGWLSIDTHVHSAHSPDSRMDPAGQTLHAAAHGLDVVLHTEHEHIVDERDNPVRAGVQGFVASLIGQEVTATVPEHMTMFPVLPDGSPRGGPVRWYQMDIAELWAAMHARSEGGINILNHPGYMDLVGWDYVAAAPTLTDPTLLGLAPDAALWAWDLDGIEVMNGHGSPFANGNLRFEKWQSLLNAGHRVVAVGCSDDHGGDEVGFPRTYFRSDAEVSSLDPREVVDAFRAGEAIVSTGAFARVTLDGDGPGAVVQATGTAELTVEIDAPRAIDVTHAVVFAGCDEVASLPADDPGGVHKLAATVPIPVDGDTQIVVAAFGAGRLPAGLPDFDPNGVPRVLTNPIYVDGDGDGLFGAPGGRVCAYDTGP